MANCLWIDMETTGLDANKNIPLEVGLRITDHLGAGDSGITLLIWENTISWSHEIDAGMKHPIVGPMHNKSGLWRDLSEIKSGVGFSRCQADLILTQWLKDHNIEPQTMPIYGNSIGSLDRPFLLVHFPILNEFLSYRNVDISTLKELCRNLNPEMFAKMPKNNSEDADHRVQGDIDWSIREYQFYMDNFLWVADELH